MIAVRLLPTALVLSLCVSSALAQDASETAPAEPPGSAAPAYSAPVPSDSSSRAEPPASIPAAALPVPPPAQVAPTPIPAPPIAPHYVVPVPGALPPPVGQPLYYGYAPRDELVAVETRLAELRLQRPGLGGPIALIAAGGGVAFFGAYVAMVAWLVDETDDGVVCSSYRGDGDYHCERAEHNRGLARGMALLSLTGLGTAIGGLVWMSNRLKARRALKPEIDALKARRNYLLRGVRYGLNVEPGRYGLSVGAAF